MQITKKIYSGKNLYHVNSERYDPRTFYCSDSYLATQKIQIISLNHDKRKSSKERKKDHIKKENKKNCTELNLMNMIKEVHNAKPA